MRDYRPCVKDGVVGIYDSANNTFSTSSGTTAFSSPGANATYFVNSGDETVGSAIWKFASSDLSINEPYVENNNLSFEGGAMKSGPAPLTLAGLNDFGGLFTVADGTLVADFGRGLAETDRLVLDGGTYCPLSSETLNVSFDAENPKISIPSSASGGFSAYGHPLSVTIGDDASAPLVFGTETFSPGRFILNDDYADNVLTFENGMSSASSMAIETASNVAVVKGDIDNAVNFSRYGNGTLVLEGSNTLASLFMHDAGTTVLASSSRETLGWAQVDRVSAVEGADLIVSNAYLKHTGKTGSITVNCGSTLEFVDSTVSAKSIYPANRPIKGSKTGMLLIDGTVFSADEIQAGYYHSANSNATSQIVITNGSTVTVGEFYGRHGSAVQYSGYLKVTDKASGSFRLSTSGASTFTYTLYGGTIERTHSGDSGWHVGMNQQKGNSKGHFYVYGGEVIMRCKNGYIGRYGNDKKDSGRDSGSVYVRGGSLTMPYSGCALYVGHGGNGFLESSGGVIDINGSVVAVLKTSATGRRGEVQLLSGGKLIAKSLYSTCTNDVAVLVFDGGNFVAKTGSAANFVYGFTEAYIGASGGTIDTAGQNLSVVQNFAAREGQTWDVPETGDALAAAPAFTKDGEGTLVFAGTNTYLCATAVSNGTLVATCDDSLPSTTTVRLGENGVLDLSGQENTVANLIGAGKVENGTINVTGTVYPGWGDAKTLTVSSLKAGRIEYAVSGDGTTGKLKVEGPLDLSGVEIVVDNADNAESGLEIIEAESITGVPTSVLSGRYAITVYGNGVRVGLAPTIILVK